MKLKREIISDSEKYREGKLKKEPKERSEKILKDITKIPFA